MREKTRFLVVEDIHLMRDGMVGLLTARGYCVVGEAADGLEAVGKVRELRPDVVLMDLQMPNMGGLEATRRITAEFPHVKVVILTVSEDEADLFEAINSGAQGYLLKRLKSEIFFDLISGVANGEAPISPKMAAKMLSALSGHAPPGESSGRPSTLTEREMEVLGHMAGGESNKRIAANLVISESTVKYHIRNILDKLHLENRAQVIAYAMRLGLGADITPVATKFLTNVPGDGEPH